MVCRTMAVVWPGHGTRYGVPLVQDLEYMYHGMAVPFCGTYPYVHVHGTCVLYVPMVLEYHGTSTIWYHGTIAIPPPGIAIIPVVLYRVAS